MFRVCLLLVAMIGWGCESPKPVITEYFDFNQVINAQITQLKNSSLVYRKHIKKGTHEETRVLVMDSNSWANEFRMFRDFDVASPKYVSAFNVSSSSGTTRYDLKNNQPIYLKTFVRQVKGDSIQYTGTYLEEKVIYTHAKSMKILVVSDTLNRMELEVIQTKFPNDTLTYSLQIDKD